MIKIFSILSLLVLLTGCGLSPHQKQHVSQFAYATERVSRSTQHQFKMTRTNILEIEKRRLIMRNVAPPTTLDLDGGLSATGLATQLETLQALGAYGEILYALSSHAEVEQITKATADFVSHYENVNKRYDFSEALSEDKKDALLKLVGIGSSWFTEGKKKVSLTAIIHSYTPEIKKLAALLKNDLILKENSLCLANENRKTTTTIKTGVIDHYCTSAKSLKQLASSHLRRKGLTFAQRQFAYESYVMALSAIEEVRLMSIIGAQTIESLIKANDSLVKVIEQDEFKTQDIKAYAEQVNELTTLANVLTHNP